MKPLPAARDSGSRSLWPTAARRPDRGVKKKDRRPIQFAAETGSAVLDVATLAGGMARRLLRRTRVLRRPKILLAAPAVSGDTATLSAAPAPTLLAAPDGVLKP